MRLLNVHTLEVEEFIRIDSQRQKYAILSHTWEPEGEVSFADMTAYHQHKNGHESGLEHRKPRGFAKIKQCCRLAQEAGFKYAWVDTCCIDKTSSAELSESINSMFRYYSEAQICYAYLSDVPNDSKTTTLSKDGEKGSMIASRWFTRGWTLQELVAPKNVVFYAADWTIIGTKDELSGLVHHATGIDEETLNGSKLMFESSIACRMSWVSRRCTTRSEDIAYCLLGIFEIQMPLLYGEGEKAFVRLQEEIVKNSGDQTIFAWTDPTAPEDRRYSLLASSPKYFINSGDFIPYLEQLPEMLDIGVTSTSLVLKTGSRWKDKRPLMAIQCLKSRRIDQFVYIYLDPKKRAARINASQLDLSVAASGEPEIFRIARSMQVLNRELEPLTGNTISIERGKWSSDFKILKWDVQTPSRTVKSIRTGQITVFPNEYRYRPALKGDGPFDYAYLNAGPLHHVVIFMMTRV